MSKASLMPAVSAGFAVIRREPIAVLVWGLIGTVLSLLPYVAGFAIMGPGMFSIRDGNIDPAQLEAMMAGNAIQSLLSLVAMTASAAILTPAIYRAVLKPEDRENFYLRWGRDELHIGVLSLVMGVIFFISIFLSVIVLVVPFAFIFGLGAAAGIGAGIGAVATGFILSIVIFLALVWVFARLWMAAPMSVAEHRLAIFDGWAFSKGYGWPLVGVNVLLFLMILLFYILAGVLIAAVFAGTGIGASSLTGAGLAGSLLTLGLIVGVPLLVLIVSIVQVMFTAPWASAYQIIARASGRATETVFD